MKDIHVTVLTNAIVDILAHVDNSFFEEHGIQRGGYRIVSREEIAELYDKIPPAIEQSGGSLANTVSVLGALGAKACCLAKISDDAFGRIFMHDMKASHVEFPVAPTHSEERTGHSIILIDEEGDRSMNTNLGSSVEIGPEDLCVKSIQNAKILCVEGYFWSHALTRESVYYAISVAKDSKTNIAFGLSAEWCVKTFREDFLSLIETSVDILLGNELEYEALFEGDLSRVLRCLSDMPVLAVITRGNQGSIVVQGATVIHVPPTAPKQVVDATGAGDTYASGFLYGLTHGLSLEESARLGSLVAAETVAHIGARPDQTLIRKIVKEAGFEIE
jgi:sugar/nucleoside kinase (ribokinase family)